MRGFLGGDRGEARGWYLSPALGEEQRVFQHHMEAIQHLLLAVASFGLQLGGAAGDHGGGELRIEGQKISPTPALRLPELSLPQHPAPRGTLLPHRPTRPRPASRTSRA